ncbi:MAG: alpha/beta hydrolase [Clostridia bacterium]|nr:alpha/beta hydrolase [Clostridia bacterium]
MMLNEKITLIEGREDAYLEVYARPQHMGKKRPAMLVIPGGGYGTVCSDREGEPIALLYLAEGYNAFVLHYPVAPNCVSEGGESLPLIVASKAVAHIKRNAERYWVNPDQIAAVGFSAGGHLVGTLATMWHYDCIQREAGVSGEENRIAAAIMSYAVISADPELSHGGSFRNLLGADAPKEKLDFYSVEKQVSDKTCPMFIWHTVTDQLVPVRGALALADALTKAKVSYELHIYPEGYHGLASCRSDEFGSDVPAAAHHAIGWTDASVKWLHECVGFEG